MAFRSQIPPFHILRALHRTPPIANLRLLLPYSILSIAFDVPSKQRLGDSDGKILHTCTLIAPFCSSCMLLSVFPLPGIFLLVRSKLWEGFSVDSGFLSVCCHCHPGRGLRASTFSVSMQNGSHERDEPEEPVRLRMAC
jgi:hypothetical protein